MSFVVIGLMCNSLGCYWAPVDSKTKFSDQKRCYESAAAIKGKSIMYFDTACMVASER